MIVTSTDDEGTTTYTLSVDSTLTREAESILATFTAPARELIMRNQYGPRDARLAGVVVQAHADLAKLSSLINSEGIEDPTTLIVTLHTMLAEASQIIEDHVAGFSERVAEFREQVAAAFEDYPEMPPE